MALQSYEMHLSRLPRGEKHHATKVTEEQVRKIREECAEADRLRARLKELSMRAIGKRYGLAAQTVYELKHGYTWGHVA